MCQLELRRAFRLLPVWKTLSVSEKAEAVPQYMCGGGVLALRRLRTGLHARLDGRGNKGGEEDGGGTG